MAHGGAPSATTAAWVVLKLVAYAALFALASAHALARHRVRSRGWQLNRALVALLGALTLVAGLEVGATWRPRDDGLLAAYFVIFDIADAAFVALLMARRRRCSARACESDDVCRAPRR